MSFGNRVIFIWSPLPDCSHLIGRTGTTVECISSRRCIVVRLDNYDEISDRRTVHIHIDSITEFVELI